MIEADCENLIASVMKKHEIYVEFFIQNGLQTIK